MSDRTRVKCPHCDGSVFFPIGAAVNTSQGSDGVKDTAAGKSYGCLECGGNFCVTRDRVFGPDPSKRKNAPKPREAGPPPPPRKNPDADLAFSPGAMRD